VTRMRRDANAVKSSDRDEVLGRLGPLAKLRPETLNNLRNVLRNLRENEAHAAARHGFAPFPERYRREDLLLHAHLSSIDMDGGNTTDLCAIFKHFPGGDPIVRHRLVAPYSTDAVPHRLTTDGLKEPVFVGVVEFVKEIQGATLALIPTSVWLQPLDCCLMFTAKWLNQLEPTTREMRRLAAAFPTTPEDSLFKEDRELSPCQCFFACAVEHTQLIDKAIEGRTEIMSDFADTNAQLQWWKDVYKSAERILSGFRVQLGYDNSIVGFCSETSIGQTDNFDVTFCARDLETWAIKRMHDVYSDHERRQTKRQLFSSTSLNDHQPCPEQQT